MSENFTIKKHRKIPVTIKDVSVEGGDVTEAFASFKFVNSKDALVIVEIPATSNEVSKISKDLLKIGGVITAIHNHWIYDQPRMYYIHWEVRGNAIKILRGIKRLFSYL